MGKRAASITFAKPKVIKPKVIVLKSEEPEVKIEEKRSQFESPIHDIQAMPVLDTPSQVNYDSKMKSSSKFFSKVLIVLFFLAVGAGLFTYKLYSDSQDQVKKLKNPSEVSKAETQQLVDIVGKLIDLPKETPTIATVTDVKKLKNQAFFAKAVNGDKVLIFTQAKKAILYNPKSNKIIEVAPINIGQNKDTGVAGESTVATPSITQTAIPTKAVTLTPLQ